MYRHYGWHTPGLVTTGLNSCNYRVLSERQISCQNLIPWFRLTLEGSTLRGCCDRKSGASDNLSCLMVLHCYQDRVATHARIAHAFQCRTFKHGKNGFTRGIWCYNLSPILRARPLDRFPTRSPVLHACTEAFAPVGLPRAEFVCLPRGPCWTKGTAEPVPCGRWSNNYLTYKSPDHTIGCAFSRELNGTSPNTRCQFKQTRPCLSCRATGVGTWARSNLVLHSKIECGFEWMSLVWHERSDKVRPVGHVSYFLFASPHSHSKGLTIYNSSRRWSQVSLTIWEELLEVMPILRCDFE